MHGHAQTSRDWFQEYVTQGMIIIRIIITYIILGITTVLNGLFTLGFCVCVYAFMTNLRRLIVEIITGVNASKSASAFFFFMSDSLLNTVVSHCC